MDNPNDRWAAGNMASAVASDFGQRVAQWEPYKGKGDYPSERENFSMYSLSLFAYHSCTPGIPKRE